MAIRFKRGLGDVLNPTAGTALDCGLFAGGVFRKECWCMSFPSVCSQSDYVAARALADPSVYTPIMAPPAVGAPVGSVLTEDPGSGEQAQAQVDALLVQQQADWNAQNRQTIAETQAGLDQFGADYKESTSGTNWLLYGVLAIVGVFGLVAVGGGSARRYGR